MAEERKLSRADRLHEVLKKHAPKAVAYHEEHGEWPAPDFLQEGLNGEAPEPKDVVIARVSAKLQRDDGMSAEVAAKVAKDHVSGKQQAPYSIQTLRDGRTRIIVNGDEGSQAVGTGVDAEAALAQLEGGAR